MEKKIVRVVYDDAKMALVSQLLISTMQEAMRNVLRQAYKERFECNPIKDSIKLTQTPMGDMELLESVRYEVQMNGDDVGYVSYVKDHNGLSVVFNSK